MAADIRIGRVQPGQGLELRALRLQALVDTPIAFDESAEDAARRPESHWHETAASWSEGCTSALFAADQAGRWVGVAGGFHHDTGSTRIFAVFIDPPARGQRLLEALIGAVSAWSVNCGRHTLTLEVATENSRAVAAYHRLGFIETGGARPHPLYPTLTEVEMTRPAIAVASAPS
ncbi:MAG: GNAT family N-acetyltransferase [Mycobacteriales bacterium]